MTGGRFATTAVHQVRRLKEENRIRQELIRANKTNKAMIELEVQHPLALSLSSLQCKAIAYSPSQCDQQGYLSALRSSYRDPASPHVVTVKLCALHFAGVAQKGTDEQSALSEDGDDDDVRSGPWSDIGEWRS